MKMATYTVGDVELSVNMADDEVKAAFINAIQRGAETISKNCIKEAQDNAPVLTGRYRNSMEGEIDGDPLSVLNIITGNNVEYARPIEFGSSNRKGKHVITNAVAKVANSGEAKSILIDSLQNA